MRTAILLFLLAQGAQLDAAAGTPSVSPSVSSPGFVDIVIPVGWNALLNSENETGLIIGEYQTPGGAHTKLTLLTRPTLSSLAKAIEDLGYKPVLPQNTKAGTTSPGPTTGTSLPHPKLSKDFVDMVIPVGWNALLNPDKKTAGIMGEFRIPGKAHTKLFLLTCKSQAELMSIISRLGYTPLFPPAPGTPGGKPLPK